MNNKNNFIPRHGSPLFCPQDPSEGFQGSSGGLDRRRFLKRTGGATAATFIAWQTSTLKLKAVEDSDDESEHWDVKWDSSDPETGNTTSTSSFDHTYQETVDGNDIDISEDYELFLEIESGGGTAGFGLNDCQKSLSCSVFVEASVRDSEGNLLGVWETGIAITVSCDEDGNLSVTSESQDDGGNDGGGGMLPPLNSGGENQNQEEDNVVRDSAPSNEGLPATEFTVIGGFGAYLSASVDLDVVGAGTRAVSVNVSASADVSIITGDGGSVTVAGTVPENDPVTPGEDTLTLSDSFEAVKH